MHQKAIEKIIELVKAENESYAKDNNGANHFLEWEIEYYQQTDLATITVDMDTVFYPIEDTLVIDNSTADELMAIPLASITYFHAVA